MNADAHILMVDDDASIRRVVARSLQSAGFVVTAVPDRASALEALQEHDFALAILDINLPDANGLELCAELRRTHDFPIVMLTIVADESDVVHALESGADDYVRKPFSTRELVARIQSVLRRVRRDETAVLPPSLVFGELELDATSYRATVNGERLALTPTEFRLLGYLAQNAGRVLTHDQLLQYVWGAGYEGEHHMLHVTMSRLRQKLGKLEGASIRTMPGIGYEFVREAEPAGA